MFTIRWRELMLSRENYDITKINGATLFSLLTNSTERMENVDSISVPKYSFNWYSFDFEVWESIWLFLNL